MTPPTSSPAPARGLVHRAVPLALPLAVGAALFWIAYDGASYGLTNRTALAIVVWWSIALAVGLSVWPLERIPRIAFAAGGLLGAYALWTALSIAWSSSAERAFNEFDRVSLYAGIFAVVALASSRASAPRWADGMALAVVGIELVALASRFFPGFADTSELEQLLPGEAERLSYPLNYWNGLAALLALGTPLLLRAAVADASPWRRGLGLAPLPGIGVALYLTSSRGGTVAAVLACVVFLVLASRRAAALGAVAVAGICAALPLAYVAGSHSLVNGPFDSDAAASQGRVAALLVVVAGALACAVYAVLLPRYPERLRPGRRGLVAIAVVAAVLAVVALVASHPVRHFQAFKNPPAAAATSDQVRSHLLSASSNGRWQWWSSAWDEFRADPLEGNGAGSYEAWWAQHGTLPTFVRDAHSLEFETLGELGIVGFLLLGGALACGLGAGAVRRWRGDQGSVCAAFLAGFVAWLFTASIDWMWEMTAVSVFGIAFLALLTGPATAYRGPTAEAAPQRPGLRGVAAVVLVAAAPFVIGAQLIPLLAALTIRDSQAAVAHGNGAEALSDALAARRLQSWAASTHLQLALVQETLGNLPAAESSIRTATARDPQDWRLWLVRARIETKLGRVAEARTSLHRAVELNPRSPLFAGLSGG